MQHHQFEKNFGNYFSLLNVYLFYGSSLASYLLSFTVLPVSSYMMTFISGTFNF